ncbi:MAG: Sbal_3080 family lipoprotein [Planctomycetota bacterium]|nr:Sbal_3080 family lipoprotein [Planctomycetota bacterium]
MSRVAIVILASFNVLFLPACTITQEVHAVNADIVSACANKITLIRNDAVRFATFNNAVAESLERCGFIVETLPQGTNYNSLPLAMTYTANWSWDMDLYMSYARLEVFHLGKKIGDGVYDATHGGGRVISKFIKADKKVDELVYEMFPSRAPKVGTASKSASTPPTPSPSARP